MLIEISASLWQTVNMSNDFLSFSGRVMPPAEERIRDYVSPDGIRSKSHLALLLVSMLISTLSELYKLKVEWDIEQDTYAKFFHKLGVHNDAIVKRVAKQFPGMVSITNVKGMEPVDIEERKMHHIWEKVQTRAMMHWDIDSRKYCSSHMIAYRMLRLVGPCTISKYSWGDSLMMEFANGVPEGTQMKRVAPWS